MILTLVFLMAMSTGACLVFTPMIRNVAIRRGWLDQPDGLRKLHPLPVPRIGGVAVYAAFAFATAFLLVLGPIPQFSPEPLTDLLLASAAVMLVGLVDDLIGVRPLVKLVVQSGAALYLWLSGYRIDAISNPLGAESVPLDSLSLPLTLLWFVGMSNAFNLIDGLDGLAAGIGLFSTSTLFIAAVVNERWGVACVATALGGALLGFLRYNFNPASIFLGDSGSLFVGFVLAGVAVRGSIKSSAAIAVAAPLLALAVPILDASVAVLRRVVKGRSPFEADEDHIHHRLLRRGLTPQRVVIVLYAVAAAFGAASLLTMTDRGRVIGLVILATSVASWIGIQQLGYSEFGELQRILKQSLFNERQTIDNNLFLQAWPRLLARSGDLSDLWRELCRGLQRLGFVESHMVVGADWPAGLAVPPDWRADPGLARDAASTTWNVPLGRGSGELARLVLVRPLLHTPAQFETRHLYDALVTGFGRRLAELATADASSTESSRLSQVAG